MKKKKIPAYVTRALKTYDQQLTEYTTATRYNYNQSVKHFLIWNGCRPKKSDSMLKTLKAYKKHLVVNDYGPRTINLYLTSVTKFYNVVLNQFDDVSPVKVRKRLNKVHTLTDAQIRKLLQGTNNKKHLTAFRLAYGSGCNVGEIVNIKVEHIMKAPYKEIELKNRKIIVDDVTFQLISDMIPGKSINDYLFTNSNGNQLNPRSLQKALETNCSNLGIPLEGGFQTLRHTYVKSLIENGTPIETIKKLLNHSNIRTTKKTYAQFLKKRNNRIIPDVSPLKKKITVDSMFLVTIYSNGRTDFKKLNESEIKRIN